jgi:hypothetical protein
MGNVASKNHIDGEMRENVMIVIGGGEGVTFPLAPTEIQSSRGVYVLPR